MKRLLKEIDHQEARGWLTDKERDWLVEIASQVPPGNTIVNIGVEYGASVICLNKGRGEDTGLVCIDIDLSNWPYKGHYRRLNLLMIQDDSHNIYLDWSASTLAAGIKFVFVDGDHSYEGAMRDAEWSNLLGPGGVIAFHDCYEWPPEPPRTVRSVCPDVNRAVEDWLRENEDFTEIGVIDSIRVFKRVD